MVTAILWTVVTGMFMAIFVLLDYIRDLKRECDRLEHLANATPIERLGVFEPGKIYGIQATEILTAHAHARLAKQLRQVAKPLNIQFILFEKPVRPVIFERKPGDDLGRTSKVDQGRSS